MNEIEAIEKVNEWKTLAERLKTIKAKEMLLRKDLVEYITAGQINTATIGLGELELKAELKFTKSIDSKKLSLIFPALGTAEKDCIKWTPSLIAKNYSQLSPDSALLDVVTVKPAAPTLKIVSELQ